VSKDYLVLVGALHHVSGHRCEGLRPQPSRPRDGGRRAQRRVWFVFDFVELKHDAASVRGDRSLGLLPLQIRNFRSLKGSPRRMPGKPRYVFPRVDHALLPIPDTTVEMLAELLTCQLRERLSAASDAAGVTAIEMEVEENFGQSAVDRVSLR
jgi:hypothetical protein